ncbi:MAG: acetoacetate--CoA ligase [Acidimicrobiia bacterium]
MSEVLYTPPPEVVAGCGLSRYQRWLAERRGLELRSYDELWAWSVADLDGFWASLWDWFGIRAATPYTQVLGRRAMPGAEWFTGATLNYADHAFRRPDGETAVVFRSEHRPPEELTSGELRRRVAEVAAGLRELGVGPGDRVAAYAPNLPETLVAFLAAASLGAVWSSCSPDFGPTAVLDRFRQIEPKVLLAVDGHVFKGVVHDRRDVVGRLEAELPTLTASVTIPNVGLDRRGLAFDELARPGAPFEPVPVPFDHPLWVLYTSGTTGPPKALVHGHGGILLEHLKSYALHMDAGPGDRFFWYSSTGWMMWNLLVSGLAAGATVVLYDGSPAHPDVGTLWRMAAEAGVTWFGTSAPYLQACAKAGVVPAEEADLSRLRAIGSTGAPLPADGFRWVYGHVKADVHLGSVSGGTDVCSAFVGACPVLPVRAGEIQCRCLGVDVAAYDAGGRPVVGEMGELVVRQPMPSMPVAFWGDDDGRRYGASYFETFPGVWRHGDWVTFTERGSCVIAGRSDATLNRGGVRIGTAELYRVVEAVPGVADSLAVEAAGRLYLFVVLAPGVDLDDGLRAAVNGRLRAELSPRHVPDRMVAVAAVPRTLNGKKVEVPIRRLLEGDPPEAVVNVDGLADPAALEPFLALARERRSDDC